MPPPPRTLAVDPSKSVSIQPADASSVPLFSVCVAVYNVKSYLRTCLEKLREQTLQQAEFIVVDDGSTDGSSEICDEFARRDSRFRVIHHDGNQGLLRARKTGICAARGTYATILDGDDYYLTPDALVKLANLMAAQRADVLRFECRCFGEEAERVCAAQDWFTIKTADVVESGFEAAKTVYVRNEYGWSVIFRCYRVEVLRKVAAHIPDVHFVCAEDAFIVFLALFFSRRAAVVKTEPIYAYRIGSGVSTGTITMAKFPMYAREVSISRWLATAVKAEGGGSEWFTIIEALKKRLLDIAGWRLQSLPPEDQKAGFDLQVAEGFVPDYVQSLAETHWSLESMGETARNLFGAASLKRPARPRRTVGVLLPRDDDTEAHHEAERQVAMLQTLGFKVVVFIDAGQTGLDKGGVPATVECVALPCRMADGRAQVLAQALSRHAVDVVMHHQASARETLLWDVLVMKLCGVAVMVHLHELPGTEILKNSDVESARFEAMRPCLYRLADQLLVASAAFKPYFESFGCRVKVMAPSAPCDWRKTSVPEAANRQGVLWLGRWRDEAEHGEEALRVMERLSVLAPGVTCSIGSLAEDPEAEAWVKKRIAQRHLEKTVHWIGSRTDWAPLMRQCRVFLMTTAFEAFSRRLAEAQICGAPVVAYDMPYQDLLQTRQEVCVVRRHDVEGAALRAAAILADEGLCRRFSAQSRALAEAFFREHDVMQALKNVLSEERQEAPASNVRLQQWFELMADVGAEGLRRQNERHGKALEERRHRKIHAGRVMKYALLGKLALTHDKRQHYRDKLRKLFAWGEG